METKKRSNRLLYSGVAILVVLTVALFAWALTRETVEQRTKISDGLVTYQWIHRNWLTGGFKYSVGNTYYGDELLMYGFTTLHGSRHGKWVYEGDDYGMGEWYWRGEKVTEAEFARLEEEY